MLVLILPYGLLGIHLEWRVQGDQDWAVFFNRKTLQVVHVVSSSVVSLATCPVSQCEGGRDSQCDSVHVRSSGRGVSARFAGRCQVVPGCNRYRERQSNPFGGMYYHNRLTRPRPFPDRHHLRINSSSHQSQPSPSSQSTQTHPLVPMQNRLVLAPLKGTQDRLLVLGSSPTGL